jgi:hypothetical protein
MALYLKNGAVFLHIPKTGGNWVSACLKELDLLEEKKSSWGKHADIEHLFLPPSISIDGRKKFAKYAFRKLVLPPHTVKNKPYMFCFVRNPLSWYESWFKYMSQDSRKWRFWGDKIDVDKWHPNAQLNGLGSYEFNSFIRNILANKPGFVSEMYSWYTKSQIDFIGQQECLVDDFVKVLSIMNVKFDEERVRNFKKIGVSPDRSFNWDQKLKKQVALTEYPALIRYGYQQTLKDLKLDYTSLIK